MIKKRFKTNPNLEKLFFDSEEEWLNFRKDRLGASDASIIMGVSSWKDSAGRVKTPRYLWEEKLGLSDGITDTQATRYGKEMEEPARKAYNSLKGVTTEPIAVINSKYPFFMATLDGLSEDERVIVEIKNPNAFDHEQAKAGFIPEKYIPQVQMQMLIMDLDKADYFSYSKGEGALVTAYRDEAYLKVLEKKLLEFWECVSELKEPPLSDLDLIERDDEWETIAVKIWDIKEEQKRLAEERELLENRLKELSENKNSKSKNFTFKYSIAKGLIDYSSIPELKDVNLNNYRKKHSVRWTLKKINNSEHFS